MYHTSAWQKAVPQRAKTLGDGHPCLATRSSAATASAAAPRARRLKAIGDECLRSLDWDVFCWIACGTALGFLSLCSFVGCHGESSR